MANPVLPENQEKVDVNHAIADLKAVCQKYQLPMFVSVYIPDKEEYISDILSPKVLGIRLLDDRITEHLNVSLGMKTIREELPMLGIDENRNVYVMSKEEADAARAAAKERKEAEGSSDDSSGADDDDGDDFLTDDEDY